MKKVFSSVVSTLMVLGIAISGWGQSPLFTQTYSSTTYSMPTLVGWHGGLGVQALYRDQWPGIPANFVTYDAGVDGYVHKLRSGLALNYQHDRAGGSIIVTNQFNLHWSPKITLGEKSYFSPVATLTYIQSTVDWSKLTFGDHIHKRFGFIYQTNGTAIKASVNKLAFGTGAAFIREGFIASLYCGFINQPNMSFFEPAESRLPRIWRLNIAQRIPISELFSLTPTIGFQRQGEFNSLTAGLNAQYSRFIVSAAYRMWDAAMIAIGYEPKERFRLSYSYDITVSSLGTQTPGSHEIGLRALLFQGKTKRRFIENLPLM